LPNDKLSADEIRQLYERFGPSLVVYARGFLPDVASGEDVVHAVFQRLLRGDVDRPEKPIGYLYRAVRNASLNSRRSGLREAPLEESCFVHANGDRESALALQHALSELPEEQREIVVMRIWSGLTLQEAAEVSGIPPNTAASRYRYALEKLREKLQPHRAKESQTT